MRTLNSMLLLLLASSLCWAQKTPQNESELRSTQTSSASVTRSEFSKGGIGMVNKNLYIVVRSSAGDRDELIVKPTEKTEERWQGKETKSPEIVVFYGGKVWSSDQIPPGFDLSKAVIVSFESDKIRFFDFQSMQGAYYDRIRN